MVKIKIYREEILITVACFKKIHLQAQKLLEGRWAQGHDDNIALFSL
jgi:hypothetical protein